MTTFDTPPTTRRRGVDDGAGDLARKGIDEVGILDHRNVFGSHLRYGVGQSLLRTLNTKSRNDDLLDFGGRFPEHDFEPRAASYGQMEGFVAQIANLQPGGRRNGDGQGKTTGAVRRRSVRRSGFEHRSTDNRIALCIPYNACKVCRALFRAFRQRNRRRGFDERPCVRRRGEQALQKVAYGGCFDCQRDGIVQIYFRAHDETPGGLLFNRTHRLFQRSRIEVEYDIPWLRMSREGADEQEHR